MSMREYAIDYYAMVLRDEDIEPLMTSEEEDIFEAAERLCFDYEGNFTGSIRAIREDGRENYLNPSDDLDDEYFFYSELNKWSTLFEAAYKDFNEIIDEMKKNFGDVLPKDFDYRSHIKHIVGTVWG